MQQILTLTTAGKVVSTSNQGSPLGAYEPLETLNGTQKNLTGNESLWLYYIVDSETVLNFPLASTVDSLIHFVVNQGSKKMTISVNGVPTGTEIKSNTVYLAHSANNIWNFYKIV